jgi:hypothetical protein
MQERPKVGRTLVIKAKRKSNGAVGSDRKNNTGKVGIVYDTTNPGRWTEVGRVEGATFKDLCGNLRTAKLVPVHVTIDKRGDTSF